MCNTSKEPFLFNHGWDHFWFTPKNLVIKELVKGPFVKSKLAFSLPYVTLCQQEGDSLRLKKGIPDCWADYIAHNFIFLRQYLGNYELMHKEDVEVVPQLRKNYRLYIGQGIPDPWTNYPYKGNSRINARKNWKNEKKNIRYLSNNKKESCYCCEKKYLFECPDTTTANSCPCRDCHSRNETLTTDCEHNCNCISVLRDLVSKKKELKRKKKLFRKQSSESDLSLSYSRTEGDCKNVNAEFCECLGHYMPCSDVTASETEEESKEQLHNRNKMFSKNQSRLCCCPYVKNVYLKRNFCSNEGSFPKCLKIVSKQIQTENSPSKDSKTVQTDNSKSKLNLKCQCSSKCSYCDFYHCKASWTKVAFPAVHSIPNVCFPSNVIQNPAIICPFSLPNHLIIQKPSPHKEVKKGKKKLQKTKANEDGSNVELGFKPKASKTDKENVFRKSEKQDSKTDTKNDVNDNKQNIYYCQTSTNGFDLFKNFSEKKNYIHREEGFPKMSNYSSSKFLNFCNYNPSDFIVNQERFKMDKFKDFSFYKPKYSELIEDRNMIYSGNHKHLIPSQKPFNSCDQATMTVSDAGEKPKCKTASKLKCFKKTDENESKTLIRNYNETYRANRRRRRLLANRKRRRKLTANGKSSILEYQTLVELSERPELVNKQVQVERTDQDQQFSKISLPQNNHSPSGNRSFYENALLKYKDLSAVSNSLIAGTEWKIEEIAKNHSGESSKIRTLGETLRQPPWSDSRFNKTLEKIYSSNKNTWTSSALKNFVDNLITEKKSQEINAKV